MLPVHARVQDGRAALHAAAQEGHTECLKELLAKGAAVDQEDDVSGACPGAPPCCNASARRSRRAGYGGHKDPAADDQWLAAAGAI